VTSSIITLPSERSVGAPALRPGHVVGISLAVVVLWALWAAYFNTAQFGDNIEQFNWAQSLELGYHKHPPLPSWVLGCVVKLFGPSIYWAYVLATMCLLGTAFLTWQIGRELVGDRAAAAACLLWGLNMTFSQRVQLYNHNTVLVLFVAATVWLAMRASRVTRGASLWWVATGLTAGAATLSKYQALVPLAGLLMALLWSGRLRQRAQWGGLLLALLAMTAVFTPHAIWVEQHDFSTLRYASEAIETSRLDQRAGFVVSFVANQVRLWSPALLAIGLCWGWSRLVPPAERAPAQMAQMAPDLPIWMTGLVWLGLGVLVVMALAGGVSLRNHWGVQGLQFFGLWLAWRWERRVRIDLARLVCVALAVHAAGLAWYATEHRDPTTMLTSRRIDTMYPARRLARTAVAHWSATTNCPLRYVAGTVFDAGLVSLYSGGNLEVFDTESATPWVHPDDLRRHGALYVLDDDDDVPAGVTHLIEFDLLAGNRQGRSPRTIKLGILMPELRCE
jgi:4-amino-4-deoxy-L-arabinose transferase-like glycosyltransferase